MDAPAGILGAALGRRDVLDIFIDRENELAVRFADGIILRGKVRAAFERARTWVGEYTLTEEPRRFIDVGEVRWRVFVDERAIALRATSV